MGIAPRTRTAQTSTVRSHATATGATPGQGASAKTLMSAAGPAQAARRMRTASTLQDPFCANVSVDTVAMASSALTWTSARSTMAIAAAVLSSVNQLGAPNTCE